MEKDETEYKALWVSPKTHKLIKKIAVENEETIGECVERLVMESLE